MDNMPTVITINLNNAEGLKSTIQSVIEQKNCNFEYIVIDGGSKDESVDVIKEYGDRISYWISEPDSGIYNAMNKGIKKASGDYLLFLNSGDVFVSDEVLFRCSLQSKDFDIVYGDLILLDNKGVKTVKKYPGTLNFWYVWEQSLPHPSSFIRKDLFEKIGLYNEVDKITSDWQFFMLALFAYNCSYLHLPYSLTVFNTDGLSNNSANLSTINQEKSVFINQNAQIIVKSGLFTEFILQEDTLRKLRKSRIIRFITMLGLLKYLKTII